jgi:hypothetical protein
MADLTNQLQAAAGASTGVASDADFENTVLLLHGDGTNGAQNNTFLDSSTNNFTITRNGNTTQGTFTPFSKPDGRWGNYFGATGTNIYNASAALIGATASTFTLEAWIYMTSAPVDTGEAGNHGSLIIPDGVYNTNTVYMSFGPVSNRKLLFQWFTGVPNSVYYDTPLNLNQWYHVAVVANAGALSMYVDGVSVSLIGTTTLANRNGTSNNFCVGGSGQYQFIGYTSNVRVTNTAVYTSNFTPSTTPLTAISGTQLLTCQSNRFVDNSSNARALSRGGSPTVTPFSPFPITTAYSTSVNGGAGYFDGSDWLISDPAGITNAINFGTGDFEISCWCYPTSYATSRAIVDMRAANGPSFGLISLTTTGALDFYDGTSRITSNTAPLNAWNHLVVSRVSGTLKMFINGVEGYSAANTSNYNGTKLTIGTHVATTLSWMLGYIANLRIVKGSGVTSVTVPTAPATAITNTTFLANFTNAGIFDNTGFNALETVGNAQIDTTTKKYGTGSMEFDGAGDYLTYTILDSDFGSGDFTIEFWFYKLTTGGQRIVSARANNDGLTIGVNSSNLLVAFYGDSTATGVITGTTTIAINTWYHVALVRSGGTATLYLDGASTGTPTSWSAKTFTSTAYRIGSSLDSRNEHFNGFVDDLRITKGIARYTTTFTPPTAALPDLGA